jgi:hypothetical protein
MAEQYEITEQDIESMVHYLHIFHPEKATREYAIEMLEYLKASYHRLALTNPEALDALYKAFEQSKSKE